MISLQQEIDAHKMKVYGTLSVQDPFNIAIEERGAAPHPQVGEMAPSFNLPDESGKIVALNEILKSGPVILSFFKGEWCNICDLELKALQRSLPEFNKYGAIVVGISPHTVSISYQLKEKKQLSYTILSDAGNRLAEKYGLRFPMNDGLLEMFKGFGVDSMTMLHGEQQENTNTLAIPGTFIIATNGKIVYAFVDSDHTKRAEPSDIVACLASLS